MECLSGKASRLLLGESTAGQKASAASTMKPWETTLLRRSVYHSAGMNPAGAPGMK